MDAIISSFNLNISPKTSYGVLGCEISLCYRVTCFSFCNRRFCKKKRGVICAVSQLKRSGHADPLRLVSRAQLSARKTGLPTAHADYRHGL